MQGCRALAGTVRYPNIELRRVIVKHDKDKRRARLRARVNLIWKVAPHNFASGWFVPTPVGHADSVSNKLERTERLLPCGTRFLIWRNWVAVSGPSSASY